MTRALVNTIRDPSLFPDSEGFGLVPKGAIVAVMSNLAGSINLPASGTVSSDGWMRCDGAAIPALNALSGNTPNLTASTFIAGVTGTVADAAPNNNLLAGAAGGGNAKTSVTNSATWNSAVQATTFTNPTTAAHYHGMGTGATFAIAASGSHQHMQRDANVASGGAVGGNRGDIYAKGTELDTNVFNLAATHTHISSNFSGNLGLVTGGANGNTTSSTTGGAASFNKDVMNTNQVAHSHNITDSRPKFIAAVYLMRVL